MLLLWEAMVAEMRAERAEADARRHFTGDGKQIELARAEIAAWTEPAPELDPEVIALRSGGALRAIANDDLIEVG